MTWEVPYHVARLDFILSVVSFQPDGEKNENTVVVRVIASFEI